MSRGLLVTLISAVVVLAVGMAAIAAYLFLGPGIAPAASGEAPAETKEATPVGATVELEAFKTNLNDAHIRYIDVTVALGVEDEGAAEELDAMTPQIRDVIIKRIRSMSAADLSGPDGTDKLAKAIEEGLGGIDGVSDLVLKVFVTDMMVQ